MSWPAEHAVAEAYAAVTAKIAEAAARAGRSAAEIQLVAVTKDASDEQLRQIVALGQRDLGESRAQQLAHRVKALGPQLPQVVRWHMIGHLQRNKVSTILPLAAMIHSVDSLRLAEQINQTVSPDQAQDVLLQVNVSGEQSKFGVTPADAIGVAEQIHAMAGLKLRGLMTMAPYSDNPEDARPTFARCCALFHQMRDQGLGGDDFDTLSMGMTPDYEVAIEEGATLIRIGSALFRPRK